MNYKLKMMAMIAAVTLTLAGCASSPTSSPEAQQAEQKQLAADISAVKASIDKADQTMTTAKENELDWFATTDFNKAQEGLKSAKEYYAKFADKPQDANDTIGFFNSKTNIQAAREGIDNFTANLTKAETIRSQALTALEDAFANRAQLKKIKADTLYPDTYKQLDSDLKQLVDQVADGKTDAAITAQPVLLSKQRALEIKAVIKIYLSDAQAKLTQLQKAQTANYAPKTLAQAAAALMDAQAFIAAEPRATAKIKEKADGVMFAVNHAEQVSIAVKKLRAMPQSDDEGYILNFENILLNISNELGAVDSRDKILSKQGELIVQFIKDSMKNEQAAQAAQKELKTKLTEQDGALEAKDNQISMLSSKLADKTAYAKTLEDQVASLMTQLEAAKKAQTVTAPQTSEAAKTKTATTQTATTETATTPNNAAATTTDTTVTPAK